MILITAIFLVLLTVLALFPDIVLFLPRLVCGS